jgi:uncharacterized protein YvpB
MSGLLARAASAMLLLAPCAAAEAPLLDPSARARLDQIRFQAGSLAAAVGAAVAEQESLTVWRGSEDAALTSPEYVVEPFDRAVVSWNTTGPATIELEAGGQWHLMARWGDKPRSGHDPVVNTDTLELPASVDRFRFRVTPAPGSKISLVAVTHWMRGARRPLGRTPSAAWGRVLAVPQRSQANGGVDPSKICSPTSLSMVLEYHGFKHPTDEVARGVLDHESKLYGNWPFNTAYAHKLTGLEAYVRRMSSLEELEQEIAAGRPVVLSHRYERGDLDGAPISATDGHLIVVVGFTAAGDVVVNDPAGRRGGVRRVYKRAQLYKTWLERASGVVYVLRRL